MPEIRPSMLGEPAGARSRTSACGAHPSGLAAAAQSQTRGPLASSATTDEPLAAARHLGGAARAGRGAIQHHRFHA